MVHQRWRAAQMLSRIKWIDAARQQVREIFPRLLVVQAGDRIESHKAAVKDISPEVITTVMELLDGRPSGEYFHE